MSAIQEPGARHARLLALVSLSLVLVAPFASTLAWPRGQVFGEWRNGDNPEQYFFTHDFVARSLRSGEIPFWNPYSFLGYPQLAEGQAAIFHPINALYLILPTEIAMNWVIALAVVAIGWGTFGYLRALGLGYPAAWCGAVGWALSAQIVGRIDAGHLNMLVGMISWPLMLGAWERFRATGRLHHLGVLAIAYGMLNLAGYPQFTYIFSLFFLFYVLLQVVVAPRMRERLRGDLKAIAWLGLFVALGVGTGAAQLLPTWDFVERSHRREATFEFASSLSLPPEALLTLFSPTFFGNETAGPDRYWGRNVYWESCIYPGMLILVAAVVGSFTAPREKRVALVACAILFLLVSFGAISPIFHLLYNFFPLASLFRCPGKYAAITLFCTVTLAAYGLQSIFDGFAASAAAPDASAPAGGRGGIRQGDGLEIRQNTVAWRGAGVAVVGVVAVIIVVAICLFPRYTQPGAAWSNFIAWVHSHGESYVNPSEFQSEDVLSHTGRHALVQLGRALALVVGVAALLLVCVRPHWRRFAVPLAAALLVADLTGAFVSQLSYFNVEMTRLPAEFAGILSAQNCPIRVHDLSAGMLLLDDQETEVTFRNQGMHYGYSNVSGYAGMTLDRAQKVLGTDLIFYGLVRSDEDLQFLNRLHGLLATEYLIALEHQISPGTKPIAQHQGRFLVPSRPFYSRAHLLHDYQQAQESTEALEYITDFRHHPSDAPIIETDDILPTKGRLQANESARITSFGTNRIELEVNAQQARVLMLAEMYDRNWQATVNGLSRPVMPANYLLRAVVVPPGKSHVVFEYVEPTFKLGATLSAFSLAIPVGVIIASLAGRRRRAAPRSLNGPTTKASRSAVWPVPQEPNEAVTVGGTVSSLRHRWGFRRPFRRGP